MMTENDLSVIVELSFWRLFRGLSVQSGSVIPGMAFPNAEV